MSIYYFLKKHRKSAERPRNHNIKLSSSFFPIEDSAVWQPLQAMFLINLANMARLVSTFLILTKAPRFAQAQPETCCPIKVVGSTSYTLVPSDAFNGELPSRCTNSCVYTVTNTSSPKYCFRKGSLIFINCHKFIEFHLHCSTI